MQVIFDHFFALDCLLIFLTMFAVTPRGPQDEGGNSLEQQ